MTWLGILTFVVCVASSEQGKSLQCLSCTSIVPHGCHRVAQCPKIDNQVCAAHVVNVTGKILYRYHCQDYQICPSAQAPVLMGKRGGHAVQQCHQCCRDHHKCNEKLCARTECATCQGVKDPKLCKSHTLCQIGEACFTEVKNNLYFMSCQQSTACPVNNANSLIGKRNVRRGHQSLAGHCMDCCYGKECNKHLCHGYEHLPTMLLPPIGVSISISNNTHSSVTTASSSTISSTAATPSPPPPPAPTVAATTTSTTTAGVPTATAAVLTTRAGGPTATAAVLTTTAGVPTTTTTAAVPPITAAVPTTTSGTNITAGITTASVHVPTIMPVYDPNCRDLEEDGVTCASLDTVDSHNLCTDPEVFAYVLAHQKCRKHCGDCTPPPNATIVPVTLPKAGLCVDNEQDGITCDELDLFDVCSGSTNLKYVVARHKCPRHCAFCQPSSGTPTAAASPVQSPTMYPCVNIEDSSFNCTDWAAHGYCNPIPGSGYEMAKLRCRKYCGFC